jgi:ADP-heptose:LPS heptosyltransferase
MLDTMRGVIGLQVSRFRFRRFEDPVMSFTEAVTTARRAMLIMPLKKREFLPTVMVVDFFKQRFREENITIVSDDHGREAVRMLARSHFIHILKDEVSPFFLPRRTLLRRVLERQCDLVVDLNLDFLLPSAYICRESNARVRIGFDRRRADLFYNFLIQPDQRLERKHLYDRMASFLQRF